VIWVDHPLHCDCTECVARDPRCAGKRGTARSLIERLTWRGVSFRLVDGKVRFRPSTLITKAERSEIRRVKDEVYQLTTMAPTSNTSVLNALNSEVVLLLRPMSPIP
jgi:hypothetical protein